jgi:exodeoxyribonuclease VII large subunit
VDGVNANSQVCESEACRCQRFRNAWSPLASAAHRHAELHRPAAASLGMTRLGLWYRKIIRMRRGFQSMLPLMSDEPVSVSEVTAIVKALIEEDDQLRDVRVQGELSNVSRPASGHIYFTLKDAKSQIKCAMWKSQAQRLRQVPRDGDLVVVRGRVGVYEANGVYQLYAEALVPVGAGDLNAEFERLKQKLQSEGLFDNERKVPLPAAPAVIGVVTSASAAAFQDVLHVLARRYPLALVLLSPTLVQGADAPAQIVRALRRLDTRCDVVLVVRGGGSMEELWAFNDENVVRTVAALQTPVISGVGHEIDFTLTDFAADVRAPTPSAAAEIATPDIAELRMRVDAYAGALDQLLINRLQGERARLTELQRALRLLSPVAQVGHMRESLRELRMRMNSALRQRLALRREQLNSQVAQLALLGPDATLARGYAIVRRGADGGIVRSVADATSGESLRVRVTDGEFDARRE